MTIKKRPKNSANYFTNSLFQPLFLIILSAEGSNDLICSKQKSVKIFEHGFQVN